ncbi:RDD family protein [Nostocoides australiense]|nr:RDD family protein [Tetrasphaera australiensis]HRW01522.1 RDD family protein [Tetrasphaera sp.]
MTTPSAPGWYDDPEAPDQLRYFDGIVWTRHTTPRSTRAGAGAATPQAGAPVAPQPQQQPTGTADPYGWRGAGSQQGQPPQQPDQYGQQPQWSPPRQDQAPQWRPPQQQWGQPQQQWGQQAPGWGPAAGQVGPATPDGVPLAGYWQRVGAYILDLLIVGALTAICGGYWLLKAIRPWLDQVTDAINSSTTDPQRLEDLSNSLSTYLTGRDFMIFTAISLLVGLIYHVFFLTRTGATPGKMALRISVRERERPGPLPVQVALRRYLLTFVVNVLGWVPGLLSVLAGLVGIADLLWPAWDPKRQALHDKIAGTNVVRGKQPRTPANS